MLLRTLRVSLAMASPVKLLVAALGSEVLATLSGPALLALLGVVETGLATNAASLARVLAGVSLDHYTFT